MTTALHSHSSLYALLHKTLYLPVMQDLHLGGSTPEEAAAQKQQAEKRLARDIAQAVQYEEQRLETRWPYVSPCKKVCARPAALAC